MASAMFMSRICGSAGCMELPALKGRTNFNHSVALSRQLLPSDPVGTVTLTFPSVKAGSEVNIYLPDGTLSAGVDSAALGQSLVVPKYAEGSPNNVVRVFIIALGFEVLDFTMTLATSTMVPTFQRIDRSYKNPT